MDPDRPAPTVAPANSAKNSPPPTATGWHPDRHVDNARHAIDSPSGRVDGNTLDDATPPPAKNGSSKNATEPASTAAAHNYSTTTTTKHDTPSPKNSNSAAHPATTTATEQPNSSGTNHVWHVHEDTDEFFLVLDGQFDIAMRPSDATEETVELLRGDTFVVPKGTEHKPSSPGGSILMFEPSDTSTTGDRHEGAIPDHVDSTARHLL
jgi:mannose-6-phosphate isomerase-like protein (cupin superfamily)